MVVVVRSAGSCGFGGGGGGGGEGGVTVPLSSVSLCVTL